MPPHGVLMDDTNEAGSPLRHQVPNTQGGYIHSLCLIGGTFDRFHAGHQLLLSSAAKVAKRVELWVTSDELANTKSENIQSWEVRVSEISEWVESEGYGSFTMHQLEDTIGPASTCLKCDSIAATPETLPGCLTINKLREENGLSPLAIIEVPHLRGEDGRVICSSRIRNGLIDRGGRRWLDILEEETHQKMPRKLVAELKQPLGVLFEGPESEPAVAMRAALDTISEPTPKLIAVGDVSVATLLELGLVPKIGVVDGRTKRGEWVSPTPFEDNFDLTLNCDNQAGELSSSMRRTLNRHCVTMVTL